MTPLPYSDLIRVFGKIGCLSFGGPAAQIGLMHRELVEVRPWLTEAQFLKALSFCMLLPGPEAMQLATYAGWRLRGLAGGLIGGGLFVLPGALVIGLLAALYLAYGDLPGVRGAFAFVQAAVLAIVALAILKLAKKALKGVEGWVLAGLAFLALFVFGLPFPLIIGAAALWGLTRPAPEVKAAPFPLEPRRLARTLGIGLVIWFAPIAVTLALGADFLTTLGLFFAKLAVVTFGGAYAVLAYMTQEVVQTHAWVTTPQMIDALGLAETTPGPLILVTQFVAHLAGAGVGGLGLVAGILALWMTFVPCFLWIFAGAPLIDWLDGKPRLATALRAITAAVVGVILNLALWFAAHVLFAEVGEITAGPLSLVAPDLLTLRPLSLGVALAMGALLWWRPGALIPGLGAAALLGALLAAPSL